MADPLASLLCLDAATFPRRTVQLQHVLPDGSSHIDWMIAQDRAGLLPLMTFRLSKPLLRFEPERFESIVQLPDHRWAYLEYEGPLTENRGHVQRVARGMVTEIRAVDGGDHRLAELVMCWHADPQTGAETSVDPFIVAMRHDHQDQWSVMPRLENLSICDGITNQHRGQFATSARSKES